MPRRARTLGVPQMIQTRGQFGSLGSLLVVGIVITMYVGFLASNLVMGGQALASLASGASDVPGIALVGVLSVIAAIYGYDLIHAYTRWMTYISGAVLAAHRVLDRPGSRFARGFPATQYQYLERLPGNGVRRRRCGKSRMRPMCRTIRATCPSRRARDRHSGQVTGDALWDRSCRWCWVRWSALRRRAAAT